MGRQGQRGSPAALPRGESGQVGQAPEPPADVQVAGEEQRQQRQHLPASSQHQQLAQSTGGSVNRRAFIGKCLRSNRGQNMALDK